MRTALMTISALLFIAAALSTLRRPPSDNRMLAAMHDLNVSLNLKIEAKDRLIDALNGERNAQAELIVLLRHERDSFSNQVRLLRNESGLTPREPERR